MYLPLSIDITDKKILMVGGGKVATHKLKALLQFQADVTVLSPKICKEIKALKLTWIEAKYQASFLRDYFLVYACTNDSVVNQKIKTDCAKEKIGVNVADNAKLSDFISPAIYVQGEMSVAVSSQGKKIKQAILWRDKIEKLFKGR